MPKLFNTPFEVSLRILLILSAVKPRSITIDRIAAYDLMAVYGRDFGMAEQNLHGENQFSFSEFSAKREQLNGALKSLLLDGFISVAPSPGGFLFGLNERGRDFARSMQSEYAAAYMETVKKTHRMLGKTSDASLLSKITRQAMDALKRR